MFPKLSDKDKNPTQKKFLLIRKQTSKNQTVDLGDDSDPNDDIEQVHIVCGQNKQTATTSEKSSKTVSVCIKKIINVQK